MSARAGARATSFELEVYLADCRESMEATLRTVVGRWEERDLPEDVAAAVRHGVLGGGKRVRAILCISAYRACGGDGPDEALRELAAALELIHAYSLMHDDLPCMDDGELRRGRPTTHRVHGVSRTAVAGVAMIPMAVHTAFRAAEALGCPPDRARDVGRELCRAAGAGGMVGGQALDLLAEGKELDEGELAHLHGLKTGALLAASLRMGAVAAGAEAREVDALDVYGRAVGLAFQIADDVLDATATVGELGKQPSDRQLHKSTYVALHGLEGARARARREVERAVAALEGAEVRSVVLRAMARYIIDRRW